MANYNKSVNFAVKDTLQAGDPQKIVSGAEIDTEFNNISSSSTTKIDKVTSATTGNLAQFTATGAIEDSSESIASVILAAALPSGTINNFAGSSAPSGWLECDGSAVSRTDFSNLFDAIGSLYGPGDGISTFNLPDLRGEFVRGWDNGRNVDSGRSLGSNQGDEFRSHSHGVTNSDRTRVDPPFSGLVKGFLPSGGDVGGTTTEGGDETRPRNLALMYIIKT